MYELFQNPYFAGPFWAFVGIVTSLGCALAGAWLYRKGQAS